MNFSNTDAAIVVAVLVVVGSLWAWLAARGKEHRNIARKDEYPLNVQLASLGDVDKVAKRIDALETKVDARFAEAAASSAGSRDKIYNSIRELEKQNSGQEAKLEIVLQTLVQMDGKIDRMRRD